VSSRSAKCRRVVAAALASALKSPGKPSVSSPHAVSIALYGLPKMRCRPASQIAGWAAFHTVRATRARARARDGSENHRPWPADKVERWAIDRLIPYAKNARTHSDAQIAALAASVKEWVSTPERRCISGPE
jgi:hypothetical protein